MKKSRLLVVAGCLFACSPAIKASEKIDAELMKLEERIQSRNLKIEEINKTLKEYNAPDEESLEQILEQEKIKEILPNSKITAAQSIIATWRCVYELSNEQDNEKIEKLSLLKTKLPSISFEAEIDGILNPWRLSASYMY